MSNNIKEHCYRQPIANWSTIPYKSLESVLKCDGIKEEENDQVKNNQINTDQATKVTSAFPWER